ncbi:hypothetical protein MRB53_013697 [Persea americana]|uniref:Uncharacterized protein n=1 Tax=Persea americana TaxID=3435 RepID=A0ACC2K931_PERAE|nr:hypothetical protein MRB53_013697 [Persea americana]
MNPFFSRCGRRLDSVPVVAVKEGEGRERRRRVEEEGYKDKLQQQEKIQQKQLAQHQALSNCYDDGKW